MRVGRAVTSGLAVLAVTACSGASTSGAPSPASGSPAPPGSAGESGSTTSAGTVPTSSPPQPSCAQQVAGVLTPRQKAAQLVLVGMTTGSIDAASTQITAGNAGGVFMLGGWHDVTTAMDATATIHGLSATTGGIGLWVSVDQEGGEVQQLSGPGISPIPAALDQTGLGTDLQIRAAQWGSELKSVGVDINLAPVADVVPAEVGQGNAPIGQFERQYGSTPDEVTPAVIAFLQGMQQSEIAPTVKHFPGIGRIAGNTDTTSSGITDESMTTSDPLLQPFQAAIEAGTPIVMVSTARYPLLDPQNQAAFSSAIVTGLLRDQLGFGGVVMSDDVGAAKAVATVPAAERITRFVEAGGDVVLTAVPQQAQTMNDAVVARYAADPAFAAKVDAAVLRVLELKNAQTMLPCSAG